MLEPSTTYGDSHTSRMKASLWVLLLCVCVRPWMWVCVCVCLLPHIWVGACVCIIFSFSFQSGCSSAREMALSIEQGHCGPECDICPAAIHTSHRVGGGSRNPMRTALPHKTTRLQTRLRGCKSSLHDPQLPRCVCVPMCYRATRNYKPQNGCRVYVLMWGRGSVNVLHIYHPLNGCMRKWAG